jgi:hypothetical protein
VGDQGLLLTTDLLQLGLGLDLVGLSLELSLLDGSLTFNEGGLSAGLCLSGGLTGRLDGGALGLKGQELLLRLLSLSLVNDLLALEATTSLLFTTLGLVTGSGLLRLGGDLDSELNRLLQGVTSTLINRLDGLDINVGDDKVVCGEDKLVHDLAAILALAKNSATDDGGRVLVERIEGVGGNGTTDTRGKSLASISDEVRNLEETLRVLLLAREIKVPVVGDLEGQTGVIGSLNNNDVGHEVRTQKESEGLDNVRTLGNITRERHNGELLIRTQHNKLGTENSAGLLGLVIVDLNSGVVWSAEGNDTSLVTLLSRGSSGLFLAVAGGLASQQLLDDLRELLLPELLVGLQHVGLRGNGANLTSLEVTDIDTLVLIERDGTATLQDFDLNWRNIVAGTIDHPTITGLTSNLTIGEGLTSTKEDSLLGVQDVNVLNTGLKTLTRQQEERSLTLAKLALAHLNLAVDDGVNNNAILTRVEGGQLDLTNDLLINIRDVSFSLLQSDQPLLTGLAQLAENVVERLQGLQMQSLLVGQDISIGGLNNLFVDIRKVGTSVADEPFLTSLADSGALVLELLAAAQTESLVGLNDDGANNFDNLNFNARNISSRALEKPLVTGNAGGVILGEIADGAEAEGCIGGNDLERADLAIKFLTRVQREGILKHRKDWR